MLTANDRAMMRGIQSDLYHDTCIVETYSAGSSDSWGLGGQPTYTEGTSISCGFTPGRVREVMDNGQVIINEPKLRLPLTTTVTNKDRIKVTHRWGTELATAEVYAIRGITRGPSGLVLDLMRAPEEDVIER